MAKKKLNEKIKNVCFWTFAGIFWYLVISYFLLSDYPLQNYPFNHKKAYDVLKDALTLAATFLAPVAAFVLFSDWRESHVEIRNENIGLDLYNFIVKQNNDLDRIELKFRNKHSKIEKPEEELEKAQDIKLLILEKGMIISSLLDSGSSSKELIEYLKLVQLLNMDMLMFVNNLITLASLRIEIRNEELTENKNVLRNSYSANFDIYKKNSLRRYQTYHEIHEELVKKLEPIRVKN
ncbi:hypothetical protein Q5M53_08920 [Acinetobacter baumannii]|nr:hypothetical protein [Acinetobacter baumannii]